LLLTLLIVKLIPWTYFSAQSISFGLVCDWAMGIRTFSLDCIALCF